MSSNRKAEKPMSKNKDYKALLKSMAREWKWLLKYIVKYRLAIVVYVVLGVVATLMSLGVSVASKYLVDAVVAHSSNTILRSAVLAVGLVLFQYLFQAMSSWITAVVSSKANNDIRHEVYSRILCAEWSEISAFHSGDLINRIEGDAATVSSGVISFIPAVFTRSVQFLGSLVIVLYYDKTMALIALMGAPFLFLSSRFLVKTIRKYNKKSRELNGEILSYSEESMQNIQIIKAFDLTKQYIERFKFILENYRKMRLEYEKFSICMTIVLSLIGVVVSYSCYGWGIYRLWQGAITYGTMTLFIQISSVLTSSFSSLASLAPTAVAIATAAGRIMEVTEFDVENDSDREQAEKVLEASGNNGLKLVMKDVAFKYGEKENEVLKSISLSVLSGETVALIGPSGEGKTTVLKLLLGLIMPTSGEIYLEAGNGKRVKVSDSTRRFFSYVPQSVNIFSGTIAENLRMVKPDAAEAELFSALECADLAAFVRSLPEGLNTQIGERGTKLSQGQLQRLAIARALLRESKIMLLDEVTSSLDMDTEARVLENIMKTSPDRICIVTTHRESMLKYCNRVYKIAADGELSAIKE